MRSNKLVNFEKAFSDNAGSFLGTCACGKTYCTDTYNGEEPGDDKIIAEAHKLPWSISWMSFEGSTYVMDCDCWVKRAEQIMRFLDAHGRKLAAYFRLEKERKAIEAADSPVIEAERSDAPPRSSEEGSP